jgi:DNA polymerase III subunit delta'
MSGDSEVAPRQAALAALSLPWLAGPLRRALATRRGHALLIHGPGDVGQFELALALAQAWLCEEAALPLLDRPCRNCPACRLVAARSHPDLLVLMPEALRESLGWSGDAGEGDEEREASKKKPSKEIRIEAIRAAVAFATTTAARSRGKVVVVHPAERMNPAAANAFLKTLEEPAGESRFLLCSAAPDALAATIRSRCQDVALAVPPAAEAEAWLAARGVDAPAVLLAGSGGRPQEALAWAESGVDAAAWGALPGRIGRGDASAVRGWALPRVLDALQKLCHDALALACGAEPRYFPRASLGAAAEVAALLQWWRDLARLAQDVEHPWGVELAIESLVEQSREALKTPRSGGRQGQGLSLNSRR